MLHHNRTLCRPHLRTSNWVFLVLKKQTRRFLLVNTWDYLEEHCLGNKYVRIVEMNIDFYLVSQYFFRYNKKVVLPFFAMKARIAKNIKFDTLLYTMLLCNSDLKILKKWNFIARKNNPNKTLLFYITFHRKTCSYFIRAVLHRMNLFLNYAALRSARCHNF